jgi:ATP-dependent RNA helicase RhlB
LTNILQFIRDKFQKTQKSEKETEETKPVVKERKNKSRKQIPDSAGPKEVSKDRAGRQRQKSGVRPTGQEISRKEEIKESPKRWDISQFPAEALKGKTRFHDLNLPNSIMHAIADLGFQYCTPIQAEILPETLKGRDATGQAQTGTGKTAAFLIAIFTHLLRHRSKEKREPGTPRALILAPTRELALQITKDALALSQYTHLKIATVYGGMDYQKQKRQFRDEKVDVLVATPGRLLDFFKQKVIHLDKVEILVIDEADRMLDMGFIPDVRKIVHSTPPKEKRQTLFFSATLTDDVQRLSYSWTREPVTVEIEPEQVAAETVEQIIYTVTSKEKSALLYNVIQRQDLHRVIVFCNRRDETRRVADLFHRYNINCAVLSGDVPQKKRLRTLENFKEGKIRVLVATDVAGRGLHIEGMSHVINYTLPFDPEDYVHRIGRTGRAGATGTSVSFACEDDAFQIPKIQEFLGQELHCIQPEEEWLQLPPAARKRSKFPHRKTGARRSKNRYQKKSPNPKKDTDH